MRAWSHGPRIRERFEIIASEYSTSSGHGLKVKRVFSVSSFLSISVHAVRTRALTTRGEDVEGPRPTLASSVAGGTSNVFRTRKIMIWTARSSGIAMVPGGASQTTFSVV